MSELTWQKMGGVGSRGFRVFIEDYGYPWDGYLLDVQWCPRDSDCSCSLGLVRFVYW